VQQFSPGRLLHGHVASPDQCSRPFPTKTLEGTQMTFVNEVVSDEDIAKYNLPFVPNTKCYWTRDKERDYYLWGEISANYAMGYDPEGRFHLFVKGRHLSLFLSLGDGSQSLKEVPYRITWKSIMRVQPSDFAGLDPQEVICVLKEALSCFGYDGRRNVFAPVRIVTFEF
jgi:hypothetical protein